MKAFTEGAIYLFSYFQQWKPIFYLIRPRNRIFLDCVRIVENLGSSISVLTIFIFSFLQ